MAYTTGQEDVSKQDQLPYPQRGRAELKGAAKRLMGGQKPLKRMGAGQKASKWRRRG